MAGGEEQWPETARNSKLLNLQNRQGHLTVVSLIRVVSVLCRFWSYTDGGPGQS